MHLITHSLCKHPWNNQSFSSDMDLFRTRKHFLFRAELMNSRPYSQYTIACEVDMISQSLWQKLGYHVEFKVCLVSKPLKHMVFSKFFKLKEKCLLLQKFWWIYNKTITDFDFCMIWYESSTLYLCYQP